MADWPDPAADIEVAAARYRALNLLRHDAPLAVIPGPGVEHLFTGGPPDGRYVQSDLFVEDPVSGELVWRIRLEGDPALPAYEYDAGTFIRLEGGTLDLGVWRFRPSWRHPFARLRASWRRWRSPANRFDLFQEQFTDHVEVGIIRDTVEG